MITNDFLTKITPATVIGKRKAYVSIPVIPDIVQPWLGASRLFALFNYSATNNFTISSIDDYTAGEVDFRSYIACVKWIDSSGVIHRYKLFDNSTGILFVPMYNGEVIGKEFSIEIYSVQVFHDDRGVTINMSIRKTRDTLQDAETYENAVGSVCDDIYASNVNDDVDIPFPFSFSSCAVGETN